MSNVPTFVAPAATALRAPVRIQRREPGANDVEMDSVGLGGYRLRRQ